MREEHPTARRTSPLDRAISAFDRALRAVAGVEAGTGRANPASALEPLPLDDSDRRESVRLLRVDHAGEVAAQALYEGQALAARSAELRAAMREAAREESDHLAWCRHRLDELGGRTSRLDPVWYAGSFAIGVTAGLLGDRVSLGFVAETERQVVAHLDDHLERLPPDDHRSRVILSRMRDDEDNHATHAVEAGGVPLPRPVRALMQATAKVMTRTAEHL